MDEKEKTKKIFAANLNRYMYKSGKSRSEVSAALGVSYYTFSDWCLGRKYPRMDKVEKLAAYFGCLKSDLIEEKQEKPATGEGSELSPAKREFIERLKTMSEADLKRLDMLLQIFEKENS